MPNRILKEGGNNARGTDRSEEKNVVAALDSFGLGHMNVVHWEEGGSLCLSLINITSFFLRHLMYIRILRFFVLELSWM